MKSVLNTAFYCCGVRMEDAFNSNSVCNDNFAKLFMLDDGLKVYEEFKPYTRPNASALVRHKIIDDFIKNELAKTSDLQVVLIGAGFDCRAYRFKGGSWFEFDHPHIIDYKNKILPVADCDNILSRVTIDFTTESLKDKLSFIDNEKPVLFVVEGVFLYLNSDETNHLLISLTEAFPKHTLVCDLMSKGFFEKYSREVHEKFNGLNASFQDIDKQPARIFFDNKYTCLQTISVIDQARKLGIIEVPLLVLHLFLRTLLNGYSVYVFQYGG